MSRVCKIVSLTVMSVVCLIVGLALVHHPIVLAGLPHRSDLPPFIGADILCVPVAIAGYGLWSLWSEARLRRDARRMRRHRSSAR